MATTLSGYPETSIADDQLPYFPNVKVEFSSQNSDDERKKYISSSEKACNIMKRPENKTLVKFLNKLDVKKRFDFLKNTYCECFDEMKGDRSGTERMISQVIGEQVVVKLNLIDVKKALDSNPPKEKSPGYDHLQKDMEKIFRSPSSQDDSCRSSGHDTDVSSGSEGGNGNMESSQLMNTQEILETLQDNDNADQSTVADVVLSTNANDRVAPTNADRTTGKMIVSPDGRPPSTTETTETVDANEPTIPLAKSPDASMATPPCIIRAYSIPVDNLSEENFPPKETDHGEFCKLVDAYSIRPRQTRTKRKDDRPVGNGKKETRKNWPPSEARKRKRLRYKQKQIYYRKMATKNNSGVECVVSDKEDDNEKPESTTVASHVVGGTTATESVVPNERPEDEPSEEKLFITDDQMPPLLRLNLPVDPRIIDLSLTSDEEDDMDRPLIVNTGSIFDALTNQADKTVAPDVNRSSNDKSDDSEAMEIDLSPSSDNSETRLSPPGTAFKTPAVQANSVATAAVVRPKLSCRPSSSTDHVQPSVHFPNTVFAEPVPTTSGNVRRLSTALPPPPPIVLLRNTVEERTATPFSVYNRPSVMQPPPPPPPSVPLPPPLLPSSSSMMLVKDKIEDKTTAVREKIKKIVYESYRVYGRNMYIDMLVSRLKAGDLLHNMDARWNTDKAEEVRELLVRLICSLSGSHCNIVPLMGCLMTTFRRTVDTTELTDVGTYREFLVFSEVVKMCVKSRDKQFFKTWLLPDSFKYGCFIVDDVLYGGLSRVKSLHHLVNWTKISLIRKYFRMPSYRVVGLQAANDRANNELRKKLSTAINEGPPSKVAKVGQPLISTNQEVGQSIMANNQGEHHFLAANQVSQSPTLLRPAISVRPQFNVNNFPTFQQNHQLPPPPSYSESSSNSALKQRLTAPPMTPTITYAHKRPQSTLGLVNTSQAPVHYNFGSGVKNTNPYLAKYSTSYPPSYTGYLPNQQQQVRDIMHHAPSQMSTAIQQMSSMAQQMTPMNQQQMSPMTQPMLPMNQPQHTMTQQQISPTMPPLRPKPINVAQQSAPPNQWIMAGPEERLPSYGQYPKQKPIEQTWVAHDPATGQSYPITTQVSPSLPDCESPNMPDRLDQPSTSGIGAKKGLACAPKNPNQSAQDMFDYSLNNLMP